MGLLKGGSRDKFQTAQSALIRSCRTIYSKAAGVLYGENCFYFSSPSAIDEFAHTELTTIYGRDYGTKDSYGLELAPYDRLILTRSTTDA